MGEPKLLMPSKIFEIPLIKNLSINNEFEKHLLSETKKAFSDYFSRGGRSKRDAQGFISSIYIEKKSSKFMVMTKYDLGEYKEQTTIELQKSGKMKRQKYPRLLQKGMWVSASIVKNDFVKKLQADCTAHYVVLFFGDL